FFFSSRRRHTRFSRDWSSDVCSSDLNDVRWEMLLAAIAGDARFEADDFELRHRPPSYTIRTIEQLATKHCEVQLFFLIGDDNLRSEERRVGKECRIRCSWER